MFEHLLPHIRKAAHILTSQEAPLRPRLVEAGNEFWVAMSAPNQWPAEMQEKADDVLRRLLAGGTIQATVGQMDLNAAREVAMDILDLAADLEAVHSDSLHPATG
jgi:hypothetical protein